MARDSEDRLTCRDCGARGLVKVCIAYEQDRRLASTEAIGIGASPSGVAIGAGVAETASQSLFAKRLEPPKLEQPKPGLGFCLLFFSVLGITLAFPPIALITVPVGVFAFYRPFRALTAAQDEAKRLHAAAIEEWRQRWICRRCGTFAPVHTTRSNASAISPAPAGAEGLASPL
jgi:hypothetical protein